MRMLWAFITDKEVAIPIDHHEHLQDLVHAIAGETILQQREGSQNGRMYHFSNLRSQSRRILDGSIHFSAGRIEWQFASPSTPILEKVREFTQTRETVTIGGHTLRIAAVKEINAPDFSNEIMDCTCLTPLVTPAVQQPSPFLTRYLRPLHHAEAVEAVIVNELVRTYTLLTGLEHADTSVQIKFNQNYIRKDPREGTRKVRFRGEHIIGCYAPFIMIAAQDLLQTAWECGLGHRRGDGFGMISMRPPRDNGQRKHASGKDSDRHE